MEHILLFEQRDNMMVYAPGTGSWYFIASDKYFCLFVSFFPPQ